MWSAVLGMLDMNCMGIKVGCPIKEYLDNVLGLDPASPGADAARADAGKLWELLPGVYDAFCDGGGFFSLQSVINHDCVHNGSDINSPPRLFVARLCQHRLCGAAPRGLHRGARSAVHSADWLITGVLSGFGVCPIGAFQAPNCISGKQQEDADGKITIRALRAVGEGEELSLSYVKRSLKVAERQAELSRSYRFDCSCQRCRLALEKKAKKRRKLSESDRSAAAKP